MGKYPWEVAAWKKTFGKISNILKTTYMRLTDGMVSVAAVIFLGNISAESTIRVDLDHPRVEIKSRKRRKK